MSSHAMYGDFAKAVCDIWRYMVNGKLLKHNQMSPNVADGFMDGLSNYIGRQQAHKNNLKASKSLKQSVSCWRVI